MSLLLVIYLALFYRIIYCLWHWVFAILPSQVFTSYGINFLLKFLLNSSCCIKQKLSHKENLCQSNFYFLRHKVSFATFVEFFLLHNIRVIHVTSYSAQLISFNFYDIVSFTTFVKFLLRKGKIKQVICNSLRFLDL